MSVNLASETKGPRLLLGYAATTERGPPRERLGMGRAEGQDPKVQIMKDEV